MAFTPKDWVSEANPLGPPANPATATKLSGAALKDLETRVTDYTDDELAVVREGIYNAADPFYGISEGATAAANKVAIDAFLADCSSAGGGLAIFPFRGTVKTNGGHNVPVGVRIEGLHRTAPVFLNRGSTYTFRLMDETSGGPGGRLKHCGIVGSTSSDAAVSGAVGLELSNGLRHSVEDVYIYGFTNNGAGLSFHNRNGSTEYVEQCHVSNVMVVNSSRLVEFIADTSAGTSFGYNQLLDVELQIYAGQTAIQVGGGAIGSTLYNSRIIGQLHYTGDNGVGVVVKANGQIWQGSYIDIRGEMLAAYANCQRLQSVGYLEATGTFYIANGQPPDDVAGAITHEFIEDPLTYIMASQIHGMQIASASTISIPSGADFWEVTGTTNISAIRTSTEGRTVTLKFTGALTLVDGGNLKLAGNFVTTADDTITLAQRAGVWYEVARSAN